MIKQIRITRISLELVCFLVLMISVTNLKSQDLGWNLSGPNGGNVPVILVHPDDPTIIYSASGNHFTGVYKTENSGESWELLNNGLDLEPFYPSTLNILIALKMDPLYPDKLYVIYRKSNTFFIYASYNGGLEWTRILPEMSYADLVRGIVAWNENVWTSHANGDIKYSNDAGQNWVDLSNINHTGQYFFVDPYNPSNLYLGTYSDGLKVSYDGGLTFDQLGFQGRNIFYMDLFFTDTSTSIIVSVEYGIPTLTDLYFSDDGGNDWQLIPHDTSEKVWSVKFSDQGNNTIYIGTQNEGFFSTDDKGQNWNSLNNGLDSLSIMVSYIPPILSIETVASNPNKIFIGLDGFGLFYSADTGNNWTLIGIPSEYVMDIAVWENNPNKVYVGTGYGFHKKTDSNWELTTLLGPVSYGTKSISINPFNEQDIVVNYGGGFFRPALWRSLDGGNTWNYNSYLFPESSDIASLYHDKNDPDRVYGAYISYFGSVTGGVLISDNGGDSWSLKELGHGIIDLAINPNDSQTLFALARSGEVFRSDNFGIDWTEIRTGSDSTAFYSIKVSPIDPNIIFLCTYGLYRSMDSGDTWNRIPLDKWITDLSFDQNTGNVYAGTYGEGVIYSNDNGENWNQIQPELANPYISTLDIAEYDGYSILYAGTFYSSVFEMILSSVNVEESITVGIPSTIILYQNYPNPFNPTTTIRFNIGVETLHATSLQIYDLSGRLVETFIDEPLTSGEYEITWNASNLPSGVYFVRLQSGKFVKNQKILLIK
ncbi:MAG: T9SS type A sorting domain-containing protein [Planctomycetia bacterium]|nr:T9SS type A sorting domain-containing protein [Planctomycetia bacterium]